MTPFYITCAICGVFFLAVSGKSTNSTQTLANHIFFFMAVLGFIGTFYQIIP